RLNQRQTHRFLCKLSKCRGLDTDRKDANTDLRSATIKLKSRLCKPHSRVRLNASTRAPARARDNVVRQRCSDRRGPIFIWKAVATPLSPMWTSKAVQCHPASDWVL